MSAVEVLRRESALLACQGLARGGALDCLNLLPGMRFSPGYDVNDTATTIIETGRHLVTVGTAMLASTRRWLPMVSTGTPPRPPELVEKPGAHDAHRPDRNEAPEAPASPGAGGVAKVDAKEPDKAPSPATRRQYHSHWRKYVDWLGGREATELLLTRYMAYLYESGRSAGTIAVALSGVRWHAVQGECPMPGKASRACLAGIRREQVARDAIPALVGATDGKPGKGRLTDRQLDVVVKRLSERALAPRTKRAYADEWHRFLEWHAYGTPSEAALCRYVAHLAETGRSPATANLAVSAVRHHARELGIEIPGKKVRECVAGFRKESPERGLGQVSGIKWEQADRMCEKAAEVGTVRGLRDAALIAVMSDGLLRVSEAHALRVDDVRFLADGSGRALIRASKTDRRGKGFVQYLGPSTVDRIRAWREASGVRDGRLFRHLYRGGRAAKGELGERSIRKIIVDRAKEIGISERVSSHSLRVGAAESLAERNTSLVGMQRAGNWASPSMPAYYTREQEAGFGYVARLRYGVVAPTIP